MSKFSTLKDLRKDKQEQPSDQPVDVPDAQPPVAPQPAMAPRVTNPLPDTTTKIPGKRNNPAYVQRTAYIRKSTDHAVKMKLLQAGGDKEFSELVDELLSRWLQE